MARQQGLVFADDRQRGHIGVRHHLADAQPMGVLQPGELHQFTRVHHRDVVELRPATQLAVTLDEGGRGLVDRDHDDGLRVRGLDLLHRVLDLVGVALIASGSRQLEAAFGQRVFHTQQPGLAEGIVLVHHRNACHAQGVRLAHHVFGLVGIPRTHVEDPGIERVAQRLATGIGRHQRRATGFEHAFSEQLAHVGRAGKAIQGHHLRPGQQVAGQAQGVVHLVLVVRHVGADAGAVDAALGVDGIEIDLAAEHHLLAGAGQHPGQGSHLSDHDLVGGRRRGGGQCPRGYCASCGQGQQASARGGGPSVHDMSPVMGCHMSLSGFLWRYLPVRPLLRWQGRTMGAQRPG